MRPSASDRRAACRPDASERVRRAADLRRRARGAPAGAAALHAVLPLRVGRADRREPVAWSPRFSQAVKDAPGSRAVVVIGHTDTTGHDERQLRSRAASAPRWSAAFSSTPASTRRRSTSPRTASPICWCRRRTRSSSRGTDASKSRSDERSGRAGSSSCAAGAGARRRALCRSTARRSLARLEWRVYDTLVRAAGARPPGGRVVIVDVDERSLTTIGQWPWRRDLVARLIRQSAGPRRVDRRARHHVRGGGPVRRVWRRIPTRHSRTTLRRRPGRAGLCADVRRPRRNRRESACTTRSASPSSAAMTSMRSHPFFRASAAVCNLPVLAQAAGASGFLNAAPDTDGILRRVPLRRRARGHVYPASGARGGLGGHWDTGRGAARRERERLDTADSSDAKMAGVRDADLGGDCTCRSTARAICCCAIAAASARFRTCRLSTS